MKENKEIQYRIDYEIIVDCYDEYEVNSGWAIYMDENLSFPFYAKAPIKKRGKKATYQRVEIVELHTTDYEGGDFYVGADVGGIVVPVALLDLQDLEADEDTLVTIGDWVYYNR